MGYIMLDLRQAHTTLASNSVREVCVASGHSVCCQWSQCVLPVLTVCVVSAFAALLLLCNVSSSENLPTSIPTSNSTSIPTSECSLVWDVKFTIS